jgi:hypothetical protein
MKTKHTEVFCTQKAMLLNFSPSVTHDYHSLLNNVKTQINKHENINTYICIKEAGVCAEDTSVLTVWIDFELERHGHESTYKADNHS